MIEAQKQLNTSLSHRILSVVGVSFLIFEILFLILFFSDGWFAVDLQFLGIPAVIISCLLSIPFLKAMESRSACRVMSPLCKGKPPLLFLRWLSLDDSGITFGIRHVIWPAMDELHLTFFGNLVIKSRTLCGTNAKEADIIFKLPFAAADLKTQKAFLDKVRQERPHVFMNKKLLGLEKSRTLKGSFIIQILGSLIMLLALLDLGYSSFYYLEILKNYYLAEKSLFESYKEKSEQYFSKADTLYRNRFPFSFATNKLVLSSSAAAGLKDIRADILWLQGKHTDAIEQEEQALKLQENSLKRSLHLIRFLVENGQYKEAKKRLLQVIQDHKSHLNPRLYLLCLIKSQEPGMLEKTYAEQMKECKDNTFGDEPSWPPGGERFYCESIYSHDLRFILDHLLSKETPDSHSTSLPAPGSAF